MIKLFLFLIFLSSPAPNFSPAQKNMGPIDPGLDYAGLCREFKGGMDCQESLADDINEVCWCSVIDNKWVYCGCLQPNLMSREEWIEFLIYRGRKNQKDI